MKPHVPHWADRQPWISQGSILGKEGDMPASHVLGLNIWKFQNSRKLASHPGEEEQNGAVFPRVPVRALSWQWGQRGFQGWEWRGRRTAGDVRWLGCAVNNVNKLCSGGEVVRYIFLIIELCTHYETITEPKYITFQITNTSLYKGVIK